jgi:hypothetical protein
MPRLSMCGTPWVAGEKVVEVTGDYVYPVTLPPKDPAILVVRGAEGEI